MSAKVPPRTRSKRCRVELLESRQLLAATAADYVELTSSSDVYESQDALLVINYHNSKNASAD
jgi:hypothetical protein